MKVPTPDIIRAQSISGKALEKRIDKENSDEVELTTALIKAVDFASTSCTRMVPTVGSMDLEIHTIFTLTVLNSSSLI